MIMEIAGTATKRTEPTKVSLFTTPTRDVSMRINPPAPRSEAAPAANTHADKELVRKLAASTLFSALATTRGTRFVVGLVRCCMPRW